MISVILGLIVSTLKVMGTKKLFVMFIKVFEKDLKKWASSTEITTVDDGLVDVLISVREEMEK